MNASVKESKKWPSNEYAVLVHLSLNAEWGNWKVRRSQAQMTSKYPPWVKILLRLGGNRI
jgi:hypothetical protein